MGIAPEPYLSACLSVLNEAILAARFGISHQTMSSEQAVDLMECMHNIPPFLMSWESYDIGGIREELQRYDHQWPSQDGPSLCSILDRFLGETRNA
jgi:hypothetical protein